MLTSKSMNTNDWRNIKIPERIAKLPRDPERGYPVPWFVAWIDGKPVFKAADAGKLASAIKFRRCWICAQQLGKWLSFVVGPMCTVNRVSAEPPMHRDCAHYSVRVCPFLLNPKQKRSPKPITSQQEPDLKLVQPGGIMLERNPGVMALWVTHSYQLVPDHQGGFVLSMGPPTELSWFAEGRLATRQEVLAAIDSGYPLLENLAKEDGPAALALLQKQKAIALERLPTP